MNRSRVTITIRTDLLRSVDSIIDGTRIKNRSHAIESLLAKDFADRRIHKAVILAGGKGIKIEGGKEEVSRALAMHKGRPFIEYTLGWLKSQGVGEVIISANDLSAGVKEKVGNGKKFGMQVSYLAKDEGTASVLKYLVNLVDETFLMVNGDVLSETGLDEMFDFHKKCGGLCTIGMISVKEPHSFGNIMLRGNQIVDFVEKPQAGKEESYLVNAGIYIMEPDILNHVSPYCRSLEKDLFPALAKKGNLYGYYLQDPWFRLESSKK